MQRTLVALLLLLLLLVGLETRALADWDQGVAAEGKYYALIIGNDEYEYMPNLKTAVHDARALAAVLTKRYTFKKDAVTLLINATRKEILRTLSELRRTLGSEDRLLLYFAGHDNFDPATDETFWQPADAEPDKAFTWISNTEIERFLRGVAAKHVLIISSTHHMWEFPGPSPTIESDNEGTALHRSDTLKSRKVILAQWAGMLPDDLLETQSVFGQAFIKILRENTQPYLTTSQLFDRTVKSLPGSNHGPELRIIPDTGDEGGDFIFVLRSGL